MRLKTQINPGQMAIVGAAEDSIMNLMNEPGESRAMDNWNKLKRIYHLQQALGRSLQNVLDDKKNETNNSKIKKKNTRDNLLQDVRRIGRRMKLIHTIFGPISLIYYSIIVPFRFAFHSYTTPWQVVDLILDFVYITLGAFYFYSRYSEKRKLAEYTLVRKASSLFLDGFFYRTVFIFLVSAPWELYNGDLLLIKLFQVYNIRGLIDDGEATTQSIVSGRFNLQLRILLPLRKALVNLIVVIHIAACFWILVGRESTISWLHTWDPSDSYSNTDIYIQAMMFMTETISTVGYGDTPPQAEVEYWIPMFLQFVSNYFYSLFFILIREAVTKFDIVNRLIQIKKDKMISWLLTLKTRNDTNLYSTEFAKHLENFITHEKGVTIKETIKSDHHFNSLPFDLQRRLMEVLLKNDLKKFEDFLRPLSQDFMLGFIVEMIHFALEVSEELFANGHCDGIYMIDDGLIDQIVRGENRTKKLHMRGSVIGFDYLILKKKPKDIYRAVGKVKGYYVPRDAFEELTTVFGKDFLHLKHKLLNSRVVNFTNLIKCTNFCALIDKLKEEKKSENTLSIIPTQPQYPFASLNVSPNIRHSNFVNPELSLEVSRRNSVNNHLVNDFTLDMSNDNSKNPFSLSNSKCKAKTTVPKEGQNSKTGLTKAIPLSTKKGSARKEAFIRIWKEKKNDSGSSLSSEVSEDTKKDGTIEAKEKPIQYPMNLAADCLPGMIRDEDDIANESSLKFLEPTGKKTSMQGLTAVDDKAPKRSSFKVPFALEGIISQNNPLKNLADDNDSEDHDSNQISAEVVVTQFGENDQDDDDESDQGSENELENSFEILVEDVVDSSNMLDVNFFTLEEICINLDSKYRSIINQQHNLAHKLRTSASQLGKVTSMLRNKYK